MRDCWRDLPNERPAFTDLVTTISAMVGEIAGYLDLTATPLAVDVDVDIEGDVMCPLSNNCGKAT